MRTKLVFTFRWIILISQLLILPSCMQVAGSQNVVQATNISIFDSKRIAILPAKMQTSLSPDSVMAMRTEVNKGLAPALHEKLSTALIKDVADVVYQLNQTNSLTNFEQLISTYETTGVMDKRQVTTLGRILDCDFLLVSRLKSEKIDVGFISKGAGASLDVMLVDTSTSEISWAGNGEWKKGGIFGQGGAAFSEFAKHITTAAFMSLQSNGTKEPNAINPPEKKRPPSVTSKGDTEKKNASRKVISQVQHHLLNLGYEPGPIDGKLGKGTIEAIKKFQIEYNLTVTGQADMKTIGMLEQKKKEQSKQTETQPQIQETTQQTEKTVPPVSTRPSGTTTKQNTTPPSTVSPMDL
jgi:hypothetical protein